MNIGLIGPGDIGSVIVRKLRDAGYPVKMANARGPESLKALAAKTGAILVILEQVVQDDDMIFIFVALIVFYSVDAVTIAESWRQQPGSPVYCTNPTKEELQLWLKSRPFFTCHRPREWIESVLPNKGCGLPSPN